MDCVILGANVRAQALELCSVAVLRGKNCVLHNVYNQGHN